MENLETNIEEKLNRYRHFIEEILKQYGSVKPANGDVSVYSSFLDDEVHNFCDGFPFSRE